MSNYFDTEIKTGYTIWAYSPSTHIEYRWFNLHDLSLVQNQAEAQQLADGFAYVCNRDGKNQTNDWEGRIKWEEVGVQTLTNFMNLR